MKMKGAAILTLLILLQLLDATELEKLMNFNSIPSNNTKQSDKIEDVKYTLDYNTFITKLNRSHIVKRSARFLDNIAIDKIEIKFNWERFLIGKRIGSSFLLKKGHRNVENALLYAPKDGTYTVRGLSDASGYMGEITIVRDQFAYQTKTNLTNKEIFPFKIDTPRIISGKEAIEVIEALARLPDIPLKVESVSVELVLPKKQPTNIYLEVMSVSGNSSEPRALVHVVAQASSVIVNDLPSQSVMRLSLKAFNITRNPVQISSVLLFTGSVTGIGQTHVPPVSSTRIAAITQTGNAKGGGRQTVTCYVENKAPFHGFACKGSEVCIPLHWVCDGEDDCQDGFDEASCSGGLSSYSIHEAQSPNANRCRRNEFQCVSRGVFVCLPISWMCDGRTDCSNGWDEDKDNCGYSSQYNGYSHNHYTGTRCKRGYFKCRRGGCIPPRHLCDGHKDCSDGSDEYNCDDDGDDDDDDDEEYDRFDNYSCDSEYEFTCYRSRGTRKCVPQPWTCDDQNDCPAGEDEYSDTCREFPTHHHNTYD